MKAMANKCDKIASGSFFWIVLLFSFQLSSTLCTAELLINGALVNEFYKIHPNLYWAGDAEKKKMLIDILGNAAACGLNPEKYHYTYLKQNKAVLANNANAQEIDIFYTDALISYCKDLFRGDDIDAEMRYNELSAVYNKKDNDYILGSLLILNNIGELNAFIEALEPHDNLYTILKAEMAKQLKADGSKAKQIAKSLNYYRWVTHFQFANLIWINIPSASLQYYERSNVKLLTKVVLGKPSTKTPCFAAYCTSIILYPYWNVPTSISQNEIFPMFKKHPTLANNSGIQIVDKNGHIINYREIRWSSYTAFNFPYRFRQATGCDNALGVIKFNLTDPFHIYLHDTNFKGAFLLTKRYLSHGCIRIEHPMMLGNYLTNNGIDTSFLKACKKNESPILVPLNDKVPIIVSYMTAVVDSSGCVQYLTNVYKKSL